MPLPKGKNHMPYPHSDKPKKLERALLTVYSADWDGLDALAKQWGMEHEDAFSRVLKEWIDRVPKEERWEEQADA